VKKKETMIGIELYYIDWNVNRVQKRNLRILDLPRAQLFNRELVLSIHIQYSTKYKDDSKIYF
jgi:hypothetical protein